MSIKYVNANINTEGLFRTSTVPYGIIGMVGKMTSEGSASIGQTYLVRSPNSAKDLFGIKSALYESIAIAFQNGASQIYAVPADVSVETLDETFSGDESTTEFTLANQPAQPLESVTIDTTPQVEGIDFDVDYGNKKIIFTSAPETGVNNISVDYNQHSISDIETALGLLEQKQVNIIIGALINDETLLEAIYDHVITQTDLERIGVYMLKNGETATTFADIIASSKSVLIAHKSLNKDVASAFAGRIAGLRPWESLTMKPLVGIQQGDRAFSPTEFQAFDNKQINVSVDPPKLTGSGEVVSIGWTLDDTGTLVFIDQVRIALFIGEVLEVGLTNPSIIGKLPINRTGLKELDTKASAILQPWQNVGAFDRFTLVNSARVLFELTNPTPEEITARANLQASRNLSDPYAYGVEIVYAGKIIYIQVELSLIGG